MVINGLENAERNIFDHLTIRPCSFTVCKAVVVPSVAHQMLQSLSWMHSCLQELCKGQILYEDYTGDFHIQAPIVEHILLSKLPDRLASVGSSKLAAKIQLDMLPINMLTWLEVVQRCIMAYFLVGGRHGSLKITDSYKSELIQCLQSDCGIFCGSPTNVAGIDLDAQLLGRAVNNVFGKLKSVRNTLSDGSIPQMAKVLDPVKKLPTNVGSHLKNCLYEALKNNPPEWAKVQLEASISKDVYKGNASGPTKMIHEVCKVCDINQDDDKVVLCDTERCNAEYHTYCLNPPFSEIPQGN